MKLGKYFKVVDVCPYIEMVHLRPALLELAALVLEDLGIDERGIVRIIL